MNTSLRALRSAIVAAALTVAAAAHADVPGRVGRIAFMQGDVQAYSESDPEWKAAYINQPLTSRNSVFVGDSGRVEISVGSTTLAMDAGSQVDIQQLDDNTFDANVVRGHVSLQVRRLDPGDAYNVASPDATFALLQPGRYRIDALEDSSGITVFSGQASVQGEGGSTVVNAGGALRIAGEFQPVAATSLPLDNWVSEREARFRNSQTERYVSPNMTGYEDLEANGRWSSEPDVGPVWYPTTYVQQGWAPYRYGRWAYVAPWGYTWVDDAPWGFAPFHYGRWIEVGGRWGWTPGAYVARPVYAPALVGFYGGSGFNASFAVGSGPAVGWYPLAPWQRYSPHYTQNSGYINRVNNIAIVNVPQRFGGNNGGRDWNREHGATIAPQDAFASQRSISRVAIAAPRGSIDRARNFNPADLPRPASVPGAVRRGPDFGGGGGRPDFRSARDFATRGQERPASIPQQGEVRNGDRGLPSNYQRLRDDQRQQAEPGNATQPDRRFPGQRGPNEPGFDRGARPVQPTAVTNGDGQGGGNQRFVPRAPVPSAAPPAALRGDGVQSLPQPAQQDRGDRGGDRQFRENRNLQPQPAGTERQQVFERPQRQPQAPVATPAPVAPVPQQRAPIEAPRAVPQPQPQQRPQQEQRAPQAPRGGPERPPTNDNPFAQPRG